MINLFQGNFSLTALNHVLYTKNLKVISNTCRHPTIAQLNLKITLRQSTFKLWKLKYKTLGYIVF